MYAYAFGLLVLTALLTLLLAERVTDPPVNMFCRDRRPRRSAIYPRTAEDGGPYIKETRFPIWQKCGPAVPTALLKN